MNCTVTFNAQDAFLPFQAALSSALKKLKSIFQVAGGHYAATRVQWTSSDLGTQLVNSSGLPVVWMHPADDEVHGLWTIHEYAYDSMGRQWRLTTPAAFMDDFGQLVEAQL